MFEMFHDQHNLTIQADDKFEAKHFESILREKFPQVPVMTLVDKHPDDLKVYVQAPEANGWQPGQVESVIKAFEDEILQPVCPSSHIYCHACGSYNWSMEWYKWTASYIFRCNDCGNDL